MFFSPLKTFALCCSLLIAVALTAQRYTVIITEIMADPDPIVGLPAAEWIELKNNSRDTIDLQGWRIGDAAGESGLFPAFFLAPDSFVIISSRNAQQLLLQWGHTIGVTSFPSLGNVQDRIYIKNPKGDIVHAIAYHDSWYCNEVKKNGGWSLEMIDTQQPCLGKENWTSSRALAGGTPGKVNSVDSVIIATASFLLSNSYWENDTTIYIVFTNAIAEAPFIVSIDGQPYSGILLPPFYNVVEVSSAQFLRKDSVEILFPVIEDCLGNITEQLRLYLKRPQPAVAGDIVINELLFNPHPTGYDYVEIYNHTNKVIDAGGLLLANRNSAGAVAAITPLSAFPFYIYPQQFIVITVNKVSLLLHYFVPEPQQIIEVGSMPSYPNQSGTVVLLTREGEIVDEVTYAEKWHYSLLDNPRGVALERIAPSGQSNDPANWSSAATTVGYGTPTYQNSQHVTGAAKGRISLNTPVFSPDGDGRDDQLMILFEELQPQSMANVLIYNMHGILVRQLVRNNTTGSSGHWLWDGTDNKGKVVAIGNYIIVSEVYTANGAQRVYKNVVTVAKAIR